MAAPDYTKQYSFTVPTKTWQELERYCDEIKNKGIDITGPRVQALLRIFLKENNIKHTALTPRQLFTVLTNTKMYKFFS